MAQQAHSLSLVVGPLAHTQINLHVKIELGVTTFRASPLAAAPLPALAHINLGWYSSAFDQVQ